MASLGKKPYIPPQPDENTFDTQLEFLKSFESSRVPITSLAEDNRRCGFCWKDYGESDPGHDNAEGPIKFRCSHVYGETCMRDLYRMPLRSTIKLHQLDFTPGSLCESLGKGLDEYLIRYTREPNQKTRDNEVGRVVPERRGRKPSASPIQIDRVFYALCEKMLRRQGTEIPLWRDALLYVLRTHQRVTHVMFLGNGIVYDAQERYEASIFNDMFDAIDPVSTSSALTPLLSGAEAAHSQLLTPSLTVPGASLGPLITLPAVTNAQTDTAKSDSTTSSPTSPAQDASKMYVKQQEAHATQYRKDLAERIQSLSFALTRVHVAYEHFMRKQRQQALPPPTKHLTTTSQSQPVQVVRASALIHRKSIAYTDYNVQEPFGFTSMLISGGAEGDGEDDEEDPFEDVDDEAEEVESKVENKQSPMRLVVLARTVCEVCMEEEEERDKTRGILKGVRPESISWKITRNIPNTCPLCSSVLFDKVDKLGRD